MIARPFCLIAVICATLLLYASDPITFSSGRMSGSTGEKSKTTILEDSATVKAGSLELSGDRIEISGEDYRFIRAMGNVSGVDTENGFSFSAGEVRYDREQEFSIMEGGAVLEDTKNNVVCRGGLIEYDKKNEVAVMQLNVRILKDDTVCRSAYAVYRRDSSELDLTGSPVVVRKDDEFNASRILVNLDTDEIVLEGRVSGSIMQKAKEESVSDDTKKTIEESGTVDESEQQVRKDSVDGESQDMAIPKETESDHE